MELDSVARQAEIRDSLRSHRDDSMHHLIYGPPIRENRAADVHQWNLLADPLGIKLGVIISSVTNGNARKYYARLPLNLPFGMRQVVTGSISFENFFPSFPKFKLSPQKIIATESEIITACQGRNHSRVRELLEARQAHPNDRTPEDLTVFHVGDDCARYTLPQ
ncbi:hypothetical protein ACLMJK_000083 [Lecanora helva]